MTLRTVGLPGPVAAIPSRKALESLGRGLPDPITLGQEMTSLSQGQGLPARLEVGNGDPTLMIYTDRCVAWLRPTGQRKDSYRITGVAARRLKDHGRLAAGALLLRADAGWRVFGDVGQLDRQPVRFDTYWPLIEREWALLAPPEAEAAVPAHHSQYLDLLTRVVEAGQAIETAKQASAEPIRYRHRAATGEQRFSARGVYDFTLVRPSKLVAGTLVCVDERPRMRGRVLALRGLVVTVRFEAVIDFADIPPQGGLRKLPSDRVYKAQLEAIHVAQSGEAANGWLLTGLVDRQLRPFEPDHQAVPTERLDPHQMQAFRRALTVPDLSLVLGPPGTGKTRTITQIALACAQRGQRVLVTSHTNRAVDNVLQKIPPQVRSIRVGNEDVIAEEVRGLLADVQVEAVQRDVAARTEAAARRLAALSGDPDLDRWLAYLDEHLQAAATAQTRAQTHAAAFDAAAARAAAPVQVRIREAEAAVRACEVRVASAARVAARRRARDQWVQSRPALRWLGGMLHRRVEGAERARVAAQAARTPVAEELEQARARAQQLIFQDPDASRHQAQQKAAEGQVGQALGRVEQAAGALRSMIAPLLAVPPLPAHRDLSEHHHFATCLRQATATVRNRAALLAEWRASLPKAGRELQRELVRYAQVVAATCIGTATTEALSDLQFDLVIVDEAGQISLPNLLVPLVRARRAVLVGDHRQLPPFLDDDLNRWATDLAAAGDDPPSVLAEIRTLLRMSAFERLYRPHDDGHQDLLDIQRRMPREIAEFVSRTFYGGRLKTHHPGTGVDPIFGRPFVMVDTADRPVEQRSERKDRRREDWNQRSYVNELEATFIAELMAVYAGWYTDWAIIVPYRAQVELLQERLAVALGDGGRSAEQVGTVDSFQGGERDLIVYGFTRSNGQGEIGFLRELRRLNVAISRAQQQLVLIGDLNTLLRTADQPFAELIRSLVAYLGPGGVRRSLEVHSTLAARAGIRP
jgi:hypothetical protein